RGPARARSLTTSCSRERPPTAGTQRKQSVYPPPCRPQCAPACSPDGIRRPVRASQGEQAGAHTHFFRTLLQRLPGLRPPAAAECWFCLSTGASAKIWQIGMARAQQVELVPAVSKNREMPARVIYGPNLAMAQSHEHALQRRWRPECSELELSLP